MMTLQPVAMVALVSAQRLSKRFDRKLAADAIGFDIAPGEIVALLGPNGAGKTTTLRMLAGYLAPDSGVAKIAGIDPLRRPRRALSQLGFLPEGAPLYDEMTPHELIRFAARCHGISGTAAVAARDRVVDQLGLAPIIDQTVQTLSKGYRRRTALALALLHDPAALILDEPTDGLDPNQKHQLRQILNSMAPSKATIISTHLLEEVEALSTRVLLIANGRLLLDEPTSVFRSRDPQGRLDRIFHSMTAA